MGARVGRREGPGDPKERPQPLSLPFPSCLNGAKVNPFPGHPGGRLCSQKNTRQLWVAEGELSKDKRHQAAELSCLEQLSDTRACWPRAGLPTGDGAGEPWCFSSTVCGGSIPFPDRWG